MQGTYWLTVLPETSQLRPRIKRSLRGVDSDAVIRPTFDTKGAKRAGQQAGRDLQSGMESSTRGGGLGKMLRIDGARAAGQNAGREINAGIASSNIGASASSQLAANLTSGAASLGSRVGSMIATGLKVTAVGAGTVAAAGLGAALTAGFKRLTAIDDAKFKLQGLGNSTEKVQGIMDNALAAVKGTAFGLDEAATTAATAVAAGIQPGEQLTNYLKLTADTAAIAGTSLADMGSIFNKVQTSGKAFTGDLNMLADRGLPVFTWLQEATGKTGEEFQKMVEEGGISAEMFQKAVADNIAGAAQSMGGSVRGSLSNLKASFSRFGAELSGPIFAGLKPLAIGLTGTFDSVTTAIKPMMADLTARVGPWAEGMAAKMKAWADNGGVQKIVDWFGRLRDTIAGLASGGGSGALTSITESAKQLGPALQNAGPALAGVGESMKAFGSTLMQIGPETLSAVLVPALNLLAGTLKFFADNASWAVPVIGGLVLAMAGLKMAAQTVGPVFGAFSQVMNAVRTPLTVAQTLAIRQQAAAMDRLTASLGANTVSSGANSVAQNANAATTARGRIATLAAAAATKVATAAQWLWNAALTANPIGLIIAAVAAAGVAIWAFFTKTEVGRKLWDTIWGGIKNTVSTVWTWIKDTFSKAYAQIAPTLSQIGGVAREAFGAISTAAGKVWDFIKPGLVILGQLWMKFEAFRWQVIIGAFKAVGAVIGWLWTNVAVPAFAGLAMIITGWWARVKTVWEFVKPAISAVGDTIMWLWQNVAQPAFSGIGTIVSAWWQGVQQVWGALSDAVQWVGDKIMWLWHNVAQPAFSAIGAVVTAWWGTVKGVWDMVGGAVDTVITKVGELKDGFLRSFNAVKDIVLGVWDKIKGVIDSIGNGIGTVVDGLRSVPVVGNFIPGHAQGRPTGFAGGGTVRGPGTGTSDEVLAWLSNGEGVVKESAMAAGGSHIVAALNAGWVPSPDFLRGMMIPQYAEGLNPGADYLRSTIMQMWPSITSIGGRRSEDGKGEHSSGNAIDVMIPNYTSPEGIALGNAVLAFLQKNASALDVDGIIWRRMSYGYGGSLTSAKDYGDHGNDNQNHMNHLHVILGKGRGVGAASVSAPTVALSGGGSPSSLGAATSGAGGSSRAVENARTTLKNAGQRVDDATYRRDKAQARLDEAKKTGKGVDDAQHSLDVANRELADAKERQTTAADRLTEAENKAATQGDEATKDGGNEFDDLGKALAGGFFESFGLDGTFLSNPFEWPTVKSIMAGVNVLGSALSGGSGGGGASSGGSDLLGGFLGAGADAIGLDVAPGSNIAAPANSAAPDTTTQAGAAGAGYNGPPVVIENAGMGPKDVANTLDAQWNARTRTTTTTG
jgi:tape measure domain-containing protein